MLAKRAGALLRLGRYQAVRVDCDAALALLLPEDAYSRAVTGANGGACNGAAGPEAADSAGGVPAASCPSTDPGFGGVSSSEPADSSSCTKPMPPRTIDDSAGAPCSVHNAPSFAHALAARLRKEAIFLQGLAGEGSALQETFAEAACTADASGQRGEDDAAEHAADNSAGWGRGGGKLAMLLRLLLRRGSALAHGRRCEHWGAGFMCTALWVQFAA